MLRLKPSELVVTPEDIDETFRRLAQRQHARAATASSQRRTRNSGRPPPPRRRPGAQRLVRDAITDLGNIPILRPQPQQATIAHVDDDSDESVETLEAFHQTLSDTTGGPSHLEHFAPALSIEPLRNGARLPFRLSQSRRARETGQEATSSPERHNHDSEATVVEPASSPETTDVPSLATPSRGRQNEGLTTGPGPTLQPDPVAAPASLRGGASRPQSNHLRSVDQDPLLALSPLRHAHQHERGITYSGEIQPVRYLQGCFETGTHKYTFQELVPLAPHTEPLRRTNQPRLHSRSQSSTNAPPACLFTPTSSASRPSEGEDVFWTPVAPTSEHPANTRDSRPRQHSSEMSNASLAYSYYELPETRHSSRELPVQGYETANSREDSLGTYRSVRLSEAQALGDGMPRHPIPVRLGFASPEPVRGASPLPAEPYARPPTVDTETRHQLAIHHQTSQESADRGSHPSAVAAAMQNRVSPLEALTAHIGRESQRLRGYQGRQQRSARLGAGHLTRYHGGSATSSNGQNHIASGPQPSMYGSPSFAYGPSSGVGQLPAMSASPPGASNSPMTMADDPYTRGVSANAGRPYGPIARPLSAQPVPAADGTTLSLPRSTHGERSSQRSSENAPVGPSAQRVRTGRASQVRDQVSAFEQINNVAQPRQSRQRVEAPQISTALRNSALLTSPMAAAPVRIPPRTDPYRRAALSPTHGNTGRPPARMDPRLQDQENSGEAEMEMMRQEFESVRARYDETQQGDVMDETPPRIGRVERHM
ncbi:hypothetical protein SVAN01_04721 [Stagonosporopsis vannaccii]|nr:hypothetical protein SVAN01_04721 [Stagonosporopsis vannaccii]